jgi:DMSO/TMAO reductase YedYZ molybdopterin-dependent catalytic subunit
MQHAEKIVTSSYIRRKTILAFVFFLVFIGGCIAGWKWLQHQPADQAALKPLRAGLNFNETIFSNIFSDNHLVKTFPVSDAVPRVRVNGDAGMGNDFDSSTWKLHVVRKPGDTLLITMAEIKALPKTDLVFDFKCIEGWSQVTHWAGVRFSDFAKHYGLDAQTKMKFTGLETPDDEYYVGIDNKSMMHPQTILCYEMNGAPLPINQGYPLRLIIPVKYGIKHLKRIGTMYFSDTRPKDYWYERGYDYYSGL